MVILLCSHVKLTFSLSLSPSFRSWNSLREWKWFIVRSLLSVSVPLSARSESEEEWWRVICPERWPRRVLWSRPIQWRNGSSLPLCVTQLDWNVVIGESWDPRSLWWCLGPTFNKLIYSTTSCYMRNRSAFNLNFELHPVMCSFGRVVSPSQIISLMIRSS